MKKLLVLLFLVSCQNRTQQVDVTAQNGAAGQNGSSCSTEQTSFGATVSCTDGTLSYLYNGQDGATGQAGSSCSVSANSSGANISCSNGTNASILNGMNGSNGAAGTSCTVQQLSNGAKVTCGSQVAIISNGVDASLPAGALYIKEVINPCGVNAANDEVFLRLSDNRIIAVYDEGANLDRLVTAAPGNYITTDSSNHYCSFTITSDNQITNQVLH